MLTVQLVRAVVARVLRRAVCHGLAPQGASPPRRSPSPWVAGIAWSSGTRFCADGVSNGGRVGRMCACTARRLAPCSGPRAELYEEYLRGRHSRGIACSRQVNTDDAHRLTLRHRKPREARSEPAGGPSVRIYDSPWFGPRRSTRPADRASPQPDCRRVRATRYCSACCVRAARGSGRATSRHPRRRPRSTPTRADLGPHEDHRRTTKDRRSRARAPRGAISTRAPDLRRGPPKDHE